MSCRLPQLAALGSRAGQLEVTRRLNLGRSHCLHPATFQTSGTQYLIMAHNDRLCKSINLVTLRYRKANL